MQPKFVGWLRGLLLSAALLTSYIAPTNAQTPFTSMTVFGESYADRGNFSYFMSVCGTCSGGIPASALANYPRQTPWPSGTPTDTPSQLVPFTYKLQQLYGMSNSQVFDYAIGGSTTYFGIGGMSQEAQIDAFLASGRVLGPNDLVAVQFMINDGVSSVLAHLGLPSVDPLKPPPSTTDTGDPVVDAKTEAAKDAALVQKLVNAGAKTIAWLGPGDVALKPIGETGPLATPEIQSLFHAYYNTAFDALQTDLRPFALSGLRVFLFDLRIFEQRLNTNPQMYGFSSLDSAFRVALGDGLHYTEAGFGLIARYMQNQIDAPTTITPQGSLVMATANSFAEMTFGRLDSYRNFNSYGSTSPYAAYAADFGMPKKALPAGPEEVTRWSAFGGADYNGGSLDGQFYQPGTNFSSVGGSLGLEYRISPRWVAGAIFNYAQPNVDLGVQNSHLKIDAFQFGGFSSYTSKNWFVDGLLAYGYQDLNTDRLGIIDVIHGNTGANLFTVAAKAGYLLDVAALRVGPIGGLNYTHASIDGYTETGDILVTQIVGQQNIESLTGSAGVQFRLPFEAKGALYNPFINVTAEHDFLGNGRIVTTTQSTTLLLPVMTPVDGSNQTYGKAAAGIASRLGGNVLGSINAYATIGRTDGNVYGVNGSVKVAF